MFLLFHYPSFNCHVQIAFDLFRPADVTEDEYLSFYKAFSKESSEPLTYTHFVAEGEVTFKSILYVPKTAPSDLYKDFNKKQDTIKVNECFDSLHGP
jgi:HSP90 family molecular chaperone